MAQARLQGCRYRGRKLRGTRRPTRLEIAITRQRCVNAAQPKRRPGRDLCCCARGARDHHPRRHVLTQSGFREGSGGTQRPNTDAENTFGQFRRRKTGRLAFGERLSTWLDQHGGTPQRVTVSRPVRRPTSLQKRTYLPLFQVPDFVLYDNYALP